MLLLLLLLLCFFLFVCYKKFYIIHKKKQSLIKYKLLFFSKFLYVNMFCQNLKNSYILDNNLNKVYFFK